MYNKVVLVGNLTRDIELKYAQSGTAIASSAIATSRKYTSNGEKKEEVMFVDITFFGRSGEVANQYLRKGSKILVDGRLNFEQWVDQNGQKRSKHTVIVETMQMLDSRADSAANGGGNGGSYNNNQNQNQAQGSYNAPDNSSNYNAPASTGNNNYNSNNQQQQSYNAPSQNNNYNAPAQGYQQPEQQQQRQYQAPKKEMPQNNIPEIDIDEDEIPF